MADTYGEEEYSENVYGGDIDPIISTDFIEYFPQIIPREFSTIIRRYIDSHGLEYDGLDAATRYVRNSHQVDTASGRDLRRIGSLFGELGRQGTRSKAEYREYLKSLVNSFNARGSVQGLRFAIAAAVNTDIENVTIVEDFEKNEYEIKLNNVGSDFASGVVNDLAELADPSGVKLAGDPIIFTSGENLLITRDTSTVIETTTGLGGDTLTLDGNSSLQ